MNAAILAEMAQKMTLRELILSGISQEVQDKTPRSIRRIGTFCKRMNNGGIERVVATLVDIWIGMGYEVFLYTTSPADETDYAYSKSVKRHVIPGVADIKQHLPSLEKYLIEDQIDVFIPHKCSELKLLFCQVMVCKALRIPVIAYVHAHFTEIFHSCFDEALYGYKVYGLCDKVLTLNEDGKLFHELCGCDVELVQNPIDEALRKTTERAKLDQNRILWIGRFDIGKRPEDALRIFNIVAKKRADAVLDMVGAGDEQLVEKCREYCKQEHIENRVYFHGFQKDTEPYYLNASIMLMTSEEEAFPTVLIEAKAYGVPTVMYDLPYVPIARKGSGVVLVEMMSIETAAENISDLLKCAKRRREMGEEARSYFDELLDYSTRDFWDRIFRNIESGIRRRETCISTIPQLMNVIGEENYKQILRLKNSKDYKVGESVLCMPRRVKGFIRQLPLARKNDQ